MTREQAEGIKRVVVRCTNWVGDSVMTVPALRALRRVLPRAHITLVTRPGAKGLFSETDFIDDVLVYDRKGALSVIPQIREWRRRKFDLALLFQNAFEAALIPFLAGVPISNTCRRESISRSASAAYASAGHRFARLFIDPGQSATTNPSSETP